MNHALCMLTLAGLTRRHTLLHSSTLHDCPFTRELLGSIGGNPCQTYVAPQHSIGMVLIHPAIPTVEKRNSDEREGYLRLITIATFFSAVTVTALQLSDSDNLAHTKLGSVLNSMWFASLLFSIASSISSFLALAWAQSPA